MNKQSPALSLLRSTRALSKTVAERTATSKFLDSIWYRACSIQPKGFGQIFRTQLRCNWSWQTGEVTCNSDYL